MPRLSALAHDALILEARREVELIKFESTWHLGPTYMGFTQDEKAARLKIIQKRNDAIKDSIQDFNDHCSFYTVLGAVEKEFLYKQYTQLKEIYAAGFGHQSTKYNQELYVSLQKKLAYLYEPNLNVDFIKVKQDFEKSIIKADADYIAALVKELEFFQSARALRDERLIALKQESLQDIHFDFKQQENMRAVIEDDFEQSVAPFIRCINKNTDNDTAEQLDTLQNIAKNTHHDLKKLDQQKAQYSRGIEKVFKRLVPYVENKSPLKKPAIGEQWYDFLIKDIECMETPKTSEDKKPNAVKTALAKRSLADKITNSTPQFSLNPNAQAFKPASVANQGLFKQKTVKFQVPPAKSISDFDRVIGAQRKTPVTQPPVLDNLSQSYSIWDSPMPGLSQMLE